MASGAILGQCPICNEWIYEDEWIYKGDTMYHESCLKELPKLSQKYKNIRLDILEDKANQIHKSINKLLEELYDIRLEIKYLKEGINAHGEPEE